MPGRLLYLGCQPGQDVMDLQDGLNAVTGDQGQISAYPLLAVDGAFGGKTSSRVREFQQHNGLAADGVVGPATWAVLIGLLQGIPGLQINRPVGGSGSGPAKGKDGSAVHGKPSPGGDGKDPGSGGSQAKGSSSGGFGGQKSVSGQPSGGGSAKGGSGGYGDAGGSKALGGGNGMGGGASTGHQRGKNWGSAFGGSYKGGGDATALKGDGGGSGDGGGGKGGGGGGGGKKA